MRPTSSTFYALCAVGVVGSFALGMAEVRETSVIKLGSERVARDGLVSTVQVNVANRSDDERCPEIRVAARDREGLDLAEEVARPAEGSGRLPPGESVTYVAVFRDITRQEYREELDEFSAYVFRQSRC